MRSNQKQMLVRTTAWPARKLTISKITPANATLRDVADNSEAQNESGLKPGLY